MSEEFSIRDMLLNDGFRSEMQSLDGDIKLGEAWRSFMAGRSVTSEEANAMLRDLLMTSEYFDIAPPEASAAMLQRREGKRELMARILFLSDLPGSVITRLRRDVLDELQKTQA